MQDSYVVSLRTAISAERLNSYQGPITTDDTVTLANYLWNIALSESLYPLLHHAEIALRNSIHNVVNVQFNTDNWYDAEATFLQDSTVEQIARARAKLE